MIAQVDKSVQRTRMAHQLPEIVRAFHEGTEELSEAAIERALGIARAGQQPGGLTGLLRRFGNQNFSFAGTSFREIREIVRCVAPEPGKLFCDAGAGYGHMVFYLACVTDCRVRAIEIVPQRCAAMRRTQRRLGLTDLEIMQGDALVADYDDVDYLFLNNPFFPGLAREFVGGLAVSGKAGMIVIAINNIVDALREDAAFTELDVETEIPNYRFGVFRLGGPPRRRLKQFKQPGRAS